ncbi:Outer membrane efflux protein [Candidatus Sulfotelmatobacter sp. SbA7]|nr:Outer membrane efflux protein [Candidatus Sulfotelmatobacter sp. SbA7]
MKRILLVLVLGSVPAGAQDPVMSLNDAVRIALDKNKSIEASGAARKAAEMRVSEARSGLLPKVNYSESWARSDNPVFVFSSLLTQHQFGTQNFQIGSLNNPDFLNNFQSQLTADQALYDAGQIKHAVRSAELTKDITSEEGRRTQMEVIAGVVRAYYDSLLSADQLNATGQAMRSAEADLERAQAIRSAGMSTDVDTLSIRVHLAGVREQQIRREADVDVARAALNDAIGLPLDTPHTLTTPLASLDYLEGSLADQQNNAVAQRPEARQAKLATSLADTQAASARSSLLPQVTLHGAFEADRQRFVTRGGDNWLVSIGLRWNLFNGFSDKARIEESKFAQQRSSAEEARTDSAIRLQVHRAYADLHAATQRIEVAQASVAEAEESLRITQNRYEAGISNVTDLLRTETTVLEARTRHLAAVRDQRIAAAMLELAAGTLTPDSAVLNERTR